MRRWERFLAVVMLAGGLAATSHATAAPAATDSGRVFRVATVPATAGIHIVYRGETHVTGRDGTTSFSAAASELTDFLTPFGLSHALRVAPVADRHGRVFRLQRWYSKRIDGERVQVAALREFVPTHIRFVNPKAGAFDAANVDRVVIKRSDGAVFTFTGKQLERPAMLQATRVVPLSGGLVSKNLLYRVQAVTIEDNNLVNRSQQAFQPADSPDVSLKLLFYSATFTARDRLFGFATGSGIRLQFPNGRVHEYAFDDSGNLVLPALPRGNYRVTVEASGLGRTSPVAMTRDQVATLKVFSYLDLAVVVLVLLSIGVGLLLVGRPALRRRVRRSFRRRRGSSETVQA